MTKKKTPSSGEGSGASPPPAPGDEAVETPGASASASGGLPRTSKKRPLPDHIKAAVARAEAVSRGRASGETFVRGGPVYIPTPPEGEEPVAEAVEPPAPAEGEGGTGEERTSALDRISPLPEDEDEEPTIGRPTKYKPEYADITRELCEEGLVDAELCDFFGISDRTLRRWKAKHLDFRRALVVGKKNADDNVLRSMYQNAVGFEQVEEKVFHTNGMITRVPVRVKVKGDTSAQRIWAANRMGWTTSENKQPPEAPTGERNITDLARKLAYAFHLLAQEQQRKGAQTIEAEPVGDGSAAA